MHEWGWRIPFLVAGVISCALPYLRSRIKESPDYMEYKATGRKENILKSLLPPVAYYLFLPWLHFPLGFFIYPWFTWTWATSQVLGSTQSYYRY